ncbi:MAG TPA: iron-containing alcohol dehydrogenase family protein [Thermodesulfobacteriota bacterium]|nr:iron-containing alcohol dehydrogenase family protein [Thermodesulfobacteriota bacterium]
MIDIFVGPRQYIQRENALEDSGKLLKPFGRRPLILGDELVFSIVRPTMEPRLRDAGLAPEFVRFGGEPSLAEISRLEKIAREKSIDFIVGTGGGKSLDTSRLTADSLNLPLITVPTSAATCSGGSAAAVVYEKGIRQKTINGKGADLALVDSRIISQAPFRLMAAGIGDALSKWYEGKPCYEQMKDPDSATQSALTLSTQVKETVLTLGLKAQQDVNAKRNSPAVERIVEANILLTGIIVGLGGSKFRIAVAHALLYGLTVLPQVHENLHGEMVSFGILVQLCLEKNEKELAILLPFFTSLGLPTTLKSLGLSNVEDPLFWEGLKRTCAPGSSVHNLPFPVDEQKLYKAMLEADERARAAQKK